MVRCEWAAVGYRAELQGVAPLCVLMQVWVLSCLQMDCYLILISGVVQTDTLKTRLLTTSNA